MDLKIRMLHFLRTMHRYTETVFAPAVEAEGLTMTQAQILFTLEECPPGSVTVGMLRGLFRENSGNCSTHCKRLEKGGFLIRQRSPLDERCVVLLLTEQGYEAARRMRQAIDSRCAVACEHMGEANWKAAIRCIEYLEEFTVDFTEQVQQKG